MAQTGRRQHQLSVAQTSAELALLGSEAGKDYTAEDIDNLFKTDVRACVRTQDRWLYLVKCKAMGLSPFAKQLHAVKKTMNKGKQDEYSIVIFMVSYHVYVSRARQAGYVPVAAVVCENDEWGGWDAAHSHPLKHIEAVGDRGPILGAWVVMKRERDDHAMTGKFLSFDEMVLDNRMNPSWRKMPIRMAHKCVIMEGCRMIAPDLAAVMGAEEVGYSLEENPPKELAVFGSTPDEQLAAQAEEVNKPDEVPVVDLDVVDAEVVEETPAPDPAERAITRSESSDLIAAFTEAKITTTGAILEACFQATGRQITRMGELKKGEFDAIIASLAGGEDA
jgi:hypothetical protein